jgi:anti-sigma-K factor RskA
MSGAAQDYDLLAAEFVLGVLSAPEAEAVEALAVREPAVVVSIEQWRNRLAPLARVIPPVPPPMSLWPRIAATIGGFEELEAPPAEYAAETVVATEPEPEPPAAVPDTVAFTEPEAVPPPESVAVTELEAPPPPAAPDTVAFAAPEAAPPQPSADPTGIADSTVVPLVQPRPETPGAFRRGWNSVAVWRGATAAALALAAVFIGITFIKPPARVPQFAAALAPADGPAPTFLAETLADGSVMIRPLAPVTVESGKDMELWALPEGATKPISLGVLPTFGRNLKPTIPVQAPTKILVSLEPQGGSPTGQPTGPVLYAGTLARIH